MVKKMSYTTIRLPTEFVENMIDPLVSKEKGLDSRSSVIKDALRYYVKEKAGVKN